jgi:hypothetical protein
MVGLLDLFDNPDLLGSIIGGQQNGGMPGMGPNGPSGMPGSPGVNPGQAMNPNAWGGSPTPQQNYQMAGQGWPTYGPDGGGFTPAAGPGGGGGVIGPANAMPAPAPGPGGVPTGPPIGPVAYPGAGGLPPSMKPLMPGQGPIEAGPGAPGAPMPITPENPNSALARAFGLNMLRAAPQRTSPLGDAISTGMAGLGRGLSAVGNMRPGTNGAQAFAAGMGGALQGGQGQTNLQTAQRRQAQNDLFNQSSIAFRNMMAADARDDSHALAGARANWLNAGAQFRANGGRDAFSGTPYAKARDLERMLDGEDERMRKMADDRFKANGDTDAYNKALDNIEGSRKKRREARAANLGINPNDHLNGMDQDHAWDYDKLSPQQRLQIPDSSWYKWKDKDGKTQFKQRDYLAKPPYQGWQPPGPEQQSQQQPSTAQAYEALNGSTDEGAYDTGETVS